MKIKKNDQVLIIKGKQTNDLDYAADKNIS